MLKIKNAIGKTRFEASSTQCASETKSNPASRIKTDLERDQNMFQDREF